MSSLTEAAEEWRQLWLKKGKCTLKKNKKREKTKKQKETKKKILHQCTLHGNNLDESDQEKWGDDDAVKHHEAIRIASQNVRGLPPFKSGYKNQQICNTIKTRDIDIFLIQEINLYWKTVDAFESWYERMKAIKGTKKYIISYNNTEEQTDNLQFGGTGIIAVGDVVHRITRVGRDTAGLGRWTWIQVQGKNSRRTRIVSAYRPIPSKRTGSVFQQHLRYLDRKSDKRDPLCAFDEDLSSLIKDWKSQGEEVIVGCDCNDDVRKGSFYDSFEEISMEESICAMHGHEGPATQQSNECRKPIDGIWTTELRKPSHSGNFPFGDGVTSDHRLVWMDINQHQLYGNHPSKTMSPSPRRLKILDPLSINKYVTVVHKYFTQLQIYEQLDQVYACTEWNDEMEAEYNRILKLSNKIKRSAEKAMRKLRMGQVEWSPALQRIRNEIDLWLSVVKLKRGGKVGKKLMLRKERKALIYDTRLLTLHQAIEFLKKAFKKYRAAKKDAATLRENFLDELSSRRAVRNNTTKEAEFKKLKISIRRKVFPGKSKAFAKINSGPQLSRYTRQIHKGVKSNVPPRAKLKRLVLKRILTVSPRTETLPF